MIWWLLACSFWAPIWGGDFSLLFHSHIAFLRHPCHQQWGMGSDLRHFDSGPLFLASFIWSKMSFLIPGSSPRPPSVVWAAQIATKRRLRRYHMPGKGNAPRKLSACPKATGDQNCCTALTVAWAESRADNATLLTVLTKIPKSLIIFFGRSLPCRRSSQVLPTSRSTKTPNSKRFYRKLRTCLAQALQLFLGATHVIVSDIWLLLQ